MRCPCCGAKLLLTADSDALARQRRNELVRRWKQRNADRYRKYQREYQKRRYRARKREAASQ
jgi:hypothetical protein